MRRVRAQRQSTASERRDRTARARIKRAIERPGPLRTTEDSAAKGRCRSGIDNISENITVAA